MSKCITCGRRFTAHEPKQGNGYAEWHAVCPVARAKHTPTPEPIESLDSPRVILQMYADIDPDELGEDKFIGHYYLDKASQALSAYITEREMEARLVELDLLEQAINIGRDIYFHKMERLEDLEARLTQSKEQQDA